MNIKISKEKQMAKKKIRIAQKNERTILKKFRRIKLLEPWEYKAQKNICKMKI